MLLLLTVLLPYIFNKVKNFLNFKVDSEENENWKKLYTLLLKIVNALHGVYKLLQFINFITFILTGRYRSIEEKVANVELE